MRFHRVSHNSSLILSSCLFLSRKVNHQGGKRVNVPESAFNKRTARRVPQLGVLAWLVRCFCCSGSIKLSWSLTLYPVLLTLWLFTLIPLKHRGHAWLLYPRTRVFHLSSHLLLSPSFILSSLHSIVAGAGCSRLH